MADQNRQPPPFAQRKLPPTLLLAVAALSCFVVGAVSLVAPGFVTELVGLAFAEPLGRAEVMTFYGGFYIGMGVFLAIAIAKPDYSRAAGLAMLVTGGGAAIARLASLLLLGVSGIIGWLLLFAEVLYTLVGLAIFKLTPALVERKPFSIR
jgi:hypothetical protein